MKLIIEKISDSDLEEHRIEFFKKALKSFIEENEDSLNNQVNQDTLFGLLSDFMSSLTENVRKYLNSNDFMHWAAKILMSSLPDKIVIGEVLTTDFVKSNYSTNFVIPDGIKTIAKDCFIDTNIESVIIPNSVKSIGMNAFRNCKKLTEVMILEGSELKSILPCAFDNCTNLTKIKIPDSVTSIGYNAFSNCYNLTNINIPDGIKIIRHYTFSRCEKLTSITIPDSVTSIEQSAFYYCRSLTNINIPDGVTEIEYGAFANCKNLTTIYYDGTKAQWEKISYDADIPKSCRVIYKK